ncbi:MAG TPA: MerR family transcriptional regulator [Candidatus Limnocylindrales bacterium]|jgi:hypothetical protein
MYTIKEAAARSGVPVALLRAWERRYGVVEPARTAGGYRLYDESSLDRLRTMRRLVDAGWAPSVAAAAILRGDVAGTDPRSADAEAGAPSAGSPIAEERLVAAFVDAAIALDPVGVEAALDRIFAAGSFEAVVDRVLVPALVGIGDAWAAGRLGVAGEHAASHAVLRRLAAAFQAAGQPDRPDGSILVGLPPGARHELAALAFSVAARRAGLPVLYLGPDLPPGDWATMTRRVHPRAAVIGSPTRADVRPAAEVARAIRSVDPALLVAMGGRFAAGAAQAADAVAADGATDGTHAAEPVTATGPGPRSAVVLPDGLVAAVDTLRDVLVGWPTGDAA